MDTRLDMPQILFEFILSGVQTEMLLKCFGAAEPGDIRSDLDLNLHETSTKTLRVHLPSSSISGYEWTSAFPSHFNSFSASVKAHCDLVNDAVFLWIMSYKWPFPFSIRLSP